MPVELLSDEQVATEGIPRAGDVARLSPLLHEHVDLLGRYDFTIPERVAAGGPRPLHNLADGPT